MERGAMTLSTPVLPLVLEAEIDTAKTGEE